MFWDKNDERIQEHNSSCGEKCRKFNEIVFPLTSNSQYKKNKWEFCIWTKTDTAVVLQK